MTPAQQTALDNHCRFAFETARKTFARLIQDGKYSVVLTVNSGWEGIEEFGGVPVWHVSVASRPGGSSRELEALCRAELEGVGNPEREWVEVGGVAFHLRRELTLEESAKVGGAVDCRGTPEWELRLRAALG